MANLLYHSYHDKLTNAENIRELAERISDENTRHRLIGLNTVITSLEIKKSNIIYIPQKDTTLRIGNAIKVADGLTRILIDLNNISLDEIINFLETKKDSFKFDDFRIRKNHLMDQLAYELGVQFYYKKGSYRELGERIEYHIYVEESITENLQGINKIGERLKHYKPGSFEYDVLISQVDRLKAKIFSKEETIIRRQLVNLLGFTGY